MNYHADMSTNILALKSFPKLERRNEQCLIFEAICYNLTIAEIFKVIAIVSTQEKLKFDPFLERIVFLIENSPTELRNEILNGLISQYLAAEKYIQFIRIAKILNAVKDKYKYSQLSIIIELFLVSKYVYVRNHAIQMVDHFWNDYPHKDSLITTFVETDFEEAIWCYIKNSDTEDLLLNYDLIFEYIRSEEFVYIMEAYSFEHLNLRNTFLAKTFDYSYPFIKSLKESDINSYLFIHVKAQRTLDPKEAREIIGSHGLSASLIRYFGKMHLHTLLIDYIKES